MTIKRIAHIVAPDADRAALSPRVYEIPSEIISRGFAVDNIAMHRTAGIVNDLDRTLAELTYVEAGLRAQAEGYDAILITPPLDYGVRLLRSSVRIPVIGGGQAAMQLAANLGRRFAIVTVWPSVLKTSYERVISDCGLDKLCTGIRFVTEEHELGSLLGVDGLIFKMGTSHNAGIVDRIERAARDAVASGADAIVLGCTCMSPIHEQLVRRLEGVPVIDPLTAGYKLAETVLSLELVQRQAAPSTHAASLHAMIDQLAGTPAPICDEACPVLSEVGEAARDKAVA